MANSHSFERLKELELSRDEIDQIGEALKKDEFRKLLADYVREIQDPENKKLYEKEITQLEKERGNDITFLHPIPCYVIKTSVNGNKKGFINICGNDLVKKPSSTPSEKNGARGLQWSLPHSLSPPSEDVDNKGERCQVFDVLFHPDTLHLAMKNNAFRDMVNNTACNAVELHFDVKLDKNNLKFPKLKYKGMTRASVIRKPSKDAPLERSAEEKEFYDKLFAQADESTQTYKKNKKPVTKIVIDDDKSEYTTPKYIIKHRRHVELEEFTEHKNSKLNSALPKELIIEVNLPLLKSAADIILDVTAKTVQLISEKPAKYKLNLSLPYHVDQDRGNAKFEKDLKKLVITLPVQQKLNPFAISDFTKEDSGVESDHGSPVSLESEEELNENSIITGNGINSELVKSVPQFRTKFLDENVHYSVPEFTCHVFNSIIAFTLNVKNVDSESLTKLIDENRKSVHVKFVSISPSFYQSNYAFMVRLPVTSVDKEAISIEVWDNNVILQIPYKSSDNNCTSYFYGLHEEELQEKFVEEPHIVNAMSECHILKSTTAQLKHCKATSLHESNDNDVKNEICESDSEDIQTSSNEIFETQSSVEETNDFDEAKGISIATSYESSGDELSCSYSPCKSRGILKRGPMPPKSFSRSISESSLDDCIGSLDYENVDSVILEDDEHGAEMSTSLKKTVRFNDVVSKQLYRFNSSILGQKKKNQRKAQKKKKALERRHSESETSEIEDRKEGDQKTLSDNQDDEEMSTDKSTKREENIFFLDM